MTTDEISNSQDIIDSRDIIARIEELSDERDGLASDASDIGDVASLKRLEEWEESDDGAELKALMALQEECEGYGDYQYGEALIRDSYFEDYARQLADDLGTIDRNASWPCNFIDWEKAAEALKQDYMAVDFAGVTYWMRA